MENKINNIFNSNNIRLVDVFITGPLQIYVSTFLKNIITEDGKTQIHRLYNLFIMYPIFLYIILNFKLPTHLQLIFFINIVTGFIFNLYNFIVIRQKYITLNM